LSSETWEGWLIRIAVFTEVFLPKIDGITTRLDQTLRCLTAEGHDALVFAPSGAAYRRAGVEVLQVRGAPFPAYPELRLAFPDPRILLALRRFAPDVIHAVGPVCLGAWGMIAARALGLPIVASYHTDLPRYAREHGMDWLEPAVWPIVRRLHGMAHVNLCPSRHTRQELLAQGLEEVGIWRGGVDAKHFHPRRGTHAMRMRLSGGVPDGPVVLYAGRLSSEKNLETLSEVAGEIPEAHIGLVGDGPARPELERALADRRATFAGFLRGEELAEAYASADIFLMPSTSETLGLSVFEAMASGCPVVAAAAGGLTDLVQHGETGLLFDPRARGAAARAVGRLLGDPMLREHCARQARKYAESYTWSDETRRLVLQYRKARILASQRGLFGRVARVLVG
jgi:glycosyltransferase involved in cell wall biosynthesis